MNKQSSNQVKRKLSSRSRKTSEISLNVNKKNFMSKTSIKAIWTMSWKQSQEEVQVHQEVDLVVICSEAAL